MSNEAADNLSGSITRPTCDEDTVAEAADA